MVEPCGEDREARQRATWKGHALSLSPRASWRHQGDARRGAERLHEAREMRRHFHPRAAQGQVVLHVFREGRLDTCRLRDGLRADRVSAVHRRPALGPVRGRDSSEHGRAEEVHRVRQRTEDEQGDQTVTLAYVFSHRPADGVDIVDYETALKRFHASLAGSPPVRFLVSSTFRTGDRYSDWYLVESYAALDFLNEADVICARSQAH